MKKKEVLVIGGGVAGLTTAGTLTRHALKVELVEKEAFLGGHAIQYACKATEACVKCGACLAEQKLKEAVEDRNINKWLSTRVKSVVRSERFEITVETEPAPIDPAKCNGCGACVAACPQEKALMWAYSAHNRPPVVLQKDACLYFNGTGCTACRDACPEGAIVFGQGATTQSIQTDAVIVAAGFQPFVPTSKPYAYGRSPNVITNLELERMLRQKRQILRPSDRSPAQKIAFIQCVGSRDAKLNHLWCSKICCGSSLRMARLIKHIAPQTELSFFYIDVQTFGKDFDVFYADCKQQIQMLRIIPGDIIPLPDGQLQLSYFDNRRAKGIDALFDMAVLAVGILPLSDSARLSELFGLKLSEAGFFVPASDTGSLPADGVFTTGTATGPMSIPETITSAEQTAWHVLRYLNRGSERNPGGLRQG